MPRSSEPFKKPTEDEPDMDQLEEWGYDTVREATDG